MRVRLESIGCRLNASELDALARRLAAAGHRIVGPGEAALLCIVNTCAVTGAAARKSRHLIRRLRRDLPTATLILTGCYAELSPDETEALGADRVVANRNKDQLFEILEEHGMLLENDASSGCELAAHGRPGRRTRAFLKVQDGCDNRCAYCVVRVARGPARSRPVSEIIEELRSIAEQGYLEVVLTGVHLGSYGRDLGVPHGLEHLVTAILRESVVQRLRLSSLEPWDVDSNLLALFDDPRLLPHLHIPLQSGCDTTLTRMARPITCAAFLELVAEARSHIPDLSVSTDIMVGFPGETDADFEASLAFVKAAAFSRLHIFRYSRRKGTLAAAMPNQVPTAVATERSRRMHALGADLELAFNRRFVGRAMPVLWESGHEIGGQRRWSGLTDNYIRVAATANATVDLTNTVADAEILTTIPGGVEGRVRGASSIPIVDQ